MEKAFGFYDELRPANDTSGRVLARIRMLTSDEGGKQWSVRAKYRPNHNFEGPENRHFFVGQIEIPEGEELHPGETRDLAITFLPVVGLGQKLQVGRRWRIQEGGKLVATAEILAVLE
jgi:translation elongation factor EF-Tu-like GTPase